MPSDKEIENQSGKGHTANLGQSQVFWFSVKLFLLIQNAVLLTSFKLTKDEQYREDVPLLSCGHLASFSSLSSHLSGEEKKKRQESEKLPLYSVMLPHALTLLGKSYKEFYWA